MPFYSAFPPPAAAMKMIYGNFGAAALRFRSRVGFGQSRILKASASEQKDRLWESFGFEKAVPRRRQKRKISVGRAVPSPSPPRCDARREYPQCAAMKKLRISVSQFYHSKSHKSTFSDRFFRSPPTKSDFPGKCGMRFGDSARGSRSA